jgi:hypothetical protein
VPPKETLARQLLDDFVLRHSTRKDYRVKQYSKHALPEEQLRAFYEDKVQELAESGLSYPLLPEVSPKVDTTASKVKVKSEAFDFEAAMDEKPKEQTKDEKSVKLDKTKEQTKDEKPAKLEKPTLKEVKEELKGQTSHIHRSADKDDPKLAAKLLLKEATRAAAGTLWAPFGWPSCRTLSHWEGRFEGDEYGHILTPAELKAWRSQDQEGNKYSFGFIDFTESVEAKPENTKEEVKTDEKDIVSSKLESSAQAPEVNWREQMRLHFHEPMQCEVQDRMVRVACRVRLLPGAGQEPKDVYGLLQTVAPKRIVLLPTAGDSSLEVGLNRHFKYSQMAEGVTTPEIHSLDVQKPSPKFPVQGIKRRFQFESDTWKKLSFLKASEDVRVARVRVMPNPNSDPRMPELRSCEAPSGLMALTDGSDSAAANGADVAGLSAVDRLPRGGALFLGLGRRSQDAVSLSSLKEHLLNTEGFPGEIEFCAPRSHSRKTWSARILAADGKAVIGWVDPQRNGVGEESERRKVGGVVPSKSGPVLRLEGSPSDQFFRARAELYKRCTLV